MSGQWVIEWSGRFCKRCDTRSECIAARRAGKAGEPRKNTLLHSLAIRVMDGIKRNDENPNHQNHEYCLCKAHGSMPKPNELSRLPPGTTAADRPRPRPDGSSGVLGCCFLVSIIPKQKNNCGVRQQHQAKQDGLSAKIAQIISTNLLPHCRLRSC